MRRKKRKFRPPDLAENDLVLISAFTLMPPAKTPASAVHGIFCASSCPEGAQQVSPGQSAAPPWVTVTLNSQCPERAQHGIANVWQSLVVPFQGVRFFVLPTQGGAPRLAPLRSALG